MLSRGPASGPRIAVAPDRVPISASRDAASAASHRLGLAGPRWRVAGARGGAFPPPLATLASPLGVFGRLSRSGLGAIASPRPPAPCRALASRAQEVPGAPRPAWQDWAWEDEPELVLPSASPVDSSAVREAKKEEKKRAKEERRRKRMERGKKKDSFGGVSAPRPAPDAATLLARRGRAAIDWDDDEAWERELTCAAAGGADGGDKGGDVSEAVRAGKGRGGVSAGGATGERSGGSSDETLTSEEEPAEDEEAERGLVEGHVSDEGDANSDSASSPASALPRIPASLRGVLPPTTDGSLPPHNEELASLLPPRCKLVVTDWRRKLVGVYSLRETLRIAAWRGTDVFLAVWKHPPAKAAEGGKQDGSGRARGDDGTSDRKRLEVPRDARSGTSASGRASTDGIRRGTSSPSPASDDYQPVVRLVKRSLVQALWRLARSSAQHPSSGATPGGALASGAPFARRPGDPQKAAPKSIRIGAQVDERDLQLKLKSIRRLLGECHRVRIQIVGVRRAPPRRPGKGGRESYLQREARLAEAARARLALADRLIAELEGEASISGRPKTTGVSVTLEVSPKGGRRKK